MVERPLLHTPYDGSSKPFTAGLKPLDLRDWIEVEGELPVFLAEKRRIYAAFADKVYVQEPDTIAAQREVLDLLVAHLIARHPEMYRLVGDTVEVDGAPSVSVGASEQPLRAASLLVAEDLILMRASPQGWRLVAGSLCFPSSWSLAEKFGAALQDIHVPVPGFGRGTRMAEIIHRIFDNLAVDQPVHRLNWSIQADGEFYQPLSHGQRVDRATTRPSRFADGDAARAFIRVERQTLRKLPVSGDILFTIRIHLDALAAIDRHTDRAALARSFADQLSRLDQAQLDYKGLTADRDRLAQALLAMAEPH